ncbi:MAG TPA: formylmethanofuran dehydrogenase subunit E family protein, partial [Williamwhitmania sp.]|nr:formylmethanofuran dehydrogenase subunit E family protein [Williamwhitmania sp.]
ASEKIWGVAESPATEVGAYSDSLTRWFDGSKEEITYVCLGPISSLNRWVKKHGEVANLRRVIWFYGGGNTSYNPEVSGVDWQELQKLPINIHLIGQLTENYPKLTESLVAKVTSTDVPLAKIMKQRFQSELLQHQLQARHFIMWDEMIPVYLAFPSLFTVHPEEQNLRIADVHIEDTSMIADGFLKLFTAQGSALRGIVLEYFPVSPDVLSPDVAPYALEIQKRHGMEEWKLVVLTNEIHQHLGIYSIVGAKMGLFAREYFGVGLDKMKVQSKAGFYPSVGCLNDGLQISTGATLGRGDIEVLTTKPSLPSAIFICHGKKLEVTLKPEYSKQAAKDISDGIVKYGNLTNGYWNMVRELSIKYWLEWDRKKMFDYKEITQ